jgi:O-antigen ligase
MDRFLDSRGFALGELIATLAAAALWWALPGLGWAPLLIAGLPWILRLAGGRLPFRRTGVDLALGIFLLTAGAGVWAAYNRELAWAKFWVIASGVLLFYALSRQPEENIWGLAGLLSVLSAAIGLYFLITNDWQAQQTKLGFIRQVGVWWMSARPTFQAPAIHPNNAASFLAVFAPFQLASLGYAWKRRKIVWASVAACAAGVSTAALLLTASRGALLTLAAVLGVSLLWSFSQLVARRIAWPAGSLFALFLAPGLVVGAGLVLTFPGGIVGLLDRLPGPASASSRVEIARNTLYLIADFPFTGGGLRAFPGLYSQYILAIPFHFIGYSHNLFLEAAVEQGLFGLLAMVVVLSWTFWRLWSSLRTRPGPLAWAALASLAVMCLHGLVTDAIYCESGSPFLFLQAGMAAALAQPRAVQRGVSTDSAPARTSHQTQGFRRAIPGMVAAGLLLVASSALFRLSLFAKWYANLGAVEMARVELADFPSGKWEDSRILPSLARAETFFEKSIRIQPDNSTASYRLGLIEALRSHFPEAVAHLEMASKRAPGHRGIQKVLGYNYTWAGQLERAEQSLAAIHEAGEEMAAYAWWWETMGRKDIAQFALGMAERLKPEN